MKETLRSLGFWLLIVFLLGVSVGGFGCYKFNDWQIHQWVKLKGFIHEETVYNIEVRP